MINLKIKSLKIDSYIWLAIILIIAGALAIFFGKSLSNYPVLSVSLETIGILTYSAGVFSAFFKALQAIGIFKEELAKIVYSEEFLGNIRDIHEIWRRVTKALHNNAFPELEGKISDAIVDKYLPTKMGYYFKNLIRTYSIEWHDKNEKIIKVTMEMEGIIIPDKNEKIVHWSLKSSEKKINSTYQKDQYHIECLSVNDKTVNNGINSKTETNPEDPDEEINIFTCELNVSDGPGKYKYKCSTIQSLSNDKIIHFQTTRYIDCFTVQFRFPSESLIVTFKPLTNDDSCFKPWGTQYDNQKMFKNNALLFVNEGFMLFINEV